MKAKDPQLLELTKMELSSGELAGCLDIGIDPGDQSRRLPLLREVGVAWYALGIYPSYAKDASIQSYLTKLESDMREALESDHKKTVGRAENSSPEVADSPRLVALGEIGIDFYHDYGSETEQAALFNAQIDIANRFSLPIVIHNREADSSVTKVLLSNPPIAGGILHCFSADYEMARVLMDKGFYISFAGNLTYNSAGNLREVATQIPIDRLLAETDSPYLSPVPFRDKPNRPANTRKVYETLAHERGDDIGTLAKAIERNLKTLLRVE